MPRTLFTSVAGGDGGELVKLTGDVVCSYCAVIIGVDAGRATVQYKRLLLENCAVNGEE